MSRTKQGPASSEAAEKIAGLQAALGMNQEEFAMQLSISHVTLINWRKGKAEPGAHNYIQLANVADDNGYQDLAVYFLEKAGVEMARLRGLLPEFKKGSPGLEQQVVGLPLLKTTAYLHAPATAPADEIEERVPVPVAFIRKREKTSLVRVRNCRFSGGQEELWMIDSSDTRIDKLWGKLVIASYSVAEPKRFVFGSQMYRVEPPGGLYSGFLQEYPGKQNPVPMLVDLRDVTASGDIALNSLRVEDDLGPDEIKQPQDRELLTMAIGHMVALAPDQPWRVIGEVIGYMGSMWLPAGRSPLALPENEWSLRANIAEAEKLIEFIERRMESAIAREKPERVVRYYADEQRKEQEKLEAMRERLAGLGGTSNAAAGHEAAESKSQPKRRKKPRP